MTQSRDLFNIYNRQRNAEYSRPYRPSDRICAGAYAHTQEQVEMGGDFRRLLALYNPLYNLESILLCTFC